jgi:hypothetical protein
VEAVLGRLMAMMRAERIAEATIAIAETTIQTFLKPVCERHHLARLSMAVQCLWQPLA